MASGLACEVRVGVRSISFQSFGRRDASFSCISLIISVSDINAFRVTWNTLFYGTSQVNTHFSHKSHRPKPRSVLALRLESPLSKEARGILASAEGSEDSVVLPLSLLSAITFDNLPEDVAIQIGMLKDQVIELEWPDRILRTGNRIVFEAEYIHTRKH